MGTFGWDIIGNDDMAQLWFGVGPQLDGLGHIAVDNLFYNCLKGEEIVFDWGVSKIGIVGDNLLNENVRNAVSFKKDEVLMPGRTVKVFASVKF